MNRAMNIGKAAEAARVSTKTIRHNEQIGLVPAAARTGSGCCRCSTTPSATTLTGSSSSSG